MSQPSTGHVELEHCLETIADIGRREHWLIDVEHLRLMPHWILGKGSMGVVVAADFHGTTVAVKVAVSGDDSLAAPADKLPNLANELCILRKIRHPNIAAFHGACVDPESGELAIVLEHVRGIRLARFVAGDDGRGGTCSFVDRHRVLLDVCSALRYLHAQSPCIVHGDLKDSNVLVGCLPLGPQARLLDFGLSRVLTRCAKPCGGTLLWTAPEVICRVEPAASADVFSLPGWFSSWRWDGCLAPKRSYEGRGWGSHPRCDGSKERRLVAGHHCFVHVVSSRHPLHGPACRKSTGSYSAGLVSAPAKAEAGPWRVQATRAASRLRPSVAHGKGGRTPNSRGRQH